MVIDVAEKDGQCPAADRFGVSSKKFLPSCVPSIHRKHLPVESGR